MTDFDAFFEEEDKKKEPINTPIIEPVVSDTGGEFEEFFNQTDTGTSLEPELPARNALYNAVRQNPDDAAKLRDLSKRSGLPAAAVDTDRQDVEANLAYQDIDFKSLLAKNPITLKFNSDPDNAAVAYDDMKTLQGVEDWFKADQIAQQDKSLFRPGEVFKNFSEVMSVLFRQQGSGLVAAGADRSPDTINDIIPFGAMPIGMEADAQLLSQQTAKNLGINSDEELQQATSEAVTQLLDTIKKDKKLLQELSPNDLNTFEEGVRAGFISLAQQAPGFAAMIVSGGKAFPMLATMGVQSYGTSYADARADDLSPEQSNAFAAINAAIEVGTELLPTSTLETIITGKSKGLTKTALKFFVQEMGTEQLATIGQTLNEYAFGLDEQLEQLIVSGDYGAAVNLQLQRQAVTAIATVVAGGTQTGVATGIGKSVEATQNHFQQKHAVADLNSDNEQRRINALTTLVEDSKLKQRSVDVLKEFVEQAQQDGDNVFIPAQQLQEYLNQNEVPADDPAFASIQEQILEASSLGADVIMPIADFVSDLVGSDHFAGLRSHMRLSSESLTPHEAQQAVTEREQMLADLVAEAEANATDHLEAREIYDGIKDQLIDTGVVDRRAAKFMAELIPAWATAKAQREGRGVAEVFDEVGLTVAGPFTDEQSRIQAARDEGLISQVPVEEDTIETGVEFNPEEPSYPLAPRGDWFGDADFKQRGGQMVMMDPQVYLDSVRPLEDTELTLDNIDDLQSHINDGGQLDPLTIGADGREDGRHRARAAINSGIDEVPVIVFGDQPDLLAQDSAEDRNLIVTHNLSAENLMAAADLGGLAAPSLATIRSDISDFDAFGEISLLADPSLLESDKARTFDADVYTPRQPRATYDIDTKKFNELEQQLDPDNLGLSKPDIQSLADGTGADNLQRSAAVQYLWLQEQGKAPTLKNRKAAPAIKKAAKLEGIIDHMTPEIKVLATVHYKDQLKKVAAADEGRTKRYEGLWFEDNGDISPRSIINFVDKVRAFRNSNGKDVHRLRDDIAKKFRVKKTRDEYDQWAADLFNDMVTGQKLFKGFTPAGNRKYIDYNMQNVIKEMTQQLQGGEASFYGAGSVRSAFANEMKTISQIQAKRDQIVTEAEMTEIKEDSSDIFQHALDDLKPFYKFDADSWGYGDDAGRAIMEGRKGLSEAFNMTPEAQQIVDDLVNYLVALPSSYFETKIQRAVDFSEFNTAVVPRGSRKDVVQVLKDAGLKVKTYDQTGKGKARKDVIAEQQKLLFQGDREKVARGFFDPKENMIRLTEAADLSTFLHESAHFFLEMERRSRSDLFTETMGWWGRNAGAVAAEAKTYVSKDVTEDQVNQWLESGNTGDQEVDRAIWRATHEQFARGFETYLMEGKAPSEGLRTAFRAFARWLNSVYKAVRGNLDVSLDNEIRQVFDRLLATEEEIARVESENNYRPLFTDAAMAGMTEEEFQKYQERQQKATSKANETLYDKLLKELTRQATKQWNAELKERQQDAETALKGTRLYGAIDKLRNGDMKLDRAMVKEQLGIDKIPPSLRNMTVTGGSGVSPDDAAALLNYRSADEMLSDITAAPPIKEVAKERAEAEMREANGDILNDGTLEKQAQEAARNTERGKVILDEIKSLSRQHRRPTIDRMVIQGLAKESIANMKLKDIRPDKYHRAEINAAQAAQTAMNNGDTQAALQHKTQQAMNFYLWREAMAARAEADKIIKFTKKFRKKSVRESLAKAGNGYLEQIDGLLERFEFHRSQRAVERDNIETWARVRSEAGDNIQLTKEALNEVLRRHYKNVPFSQLVGVADSIKNLEHVARFTNKIRVEGERIDFAEIKKQWLTALDNLPEKFKPQRTDVVSAGPGKALRWGLAQMTKMPWLLTWLDGGERVGLSHQLVMQPINDAYDAEMRMWEQAGVPVMEAINGRDKETVKRHNRKLYIPEIASDENDGHLIGHQVLAVALNTGNQSNLRKMLLGEGWATDDSQVNMDNPQLQAVLAHMTQADWEMVQLIWDRIDSLFPAMAEVHKMTSGLTLPKVEATPVVTQFGTFNGGYYPVKYDPNRNKRAQDNEDKMNEQTQSMFADGGFLRPTADTGAKHERTEFFGPIKLSLDVVPNHMQEVIHYITHFDAVRQIHKLTNDPEIATAISKRVGPEEYRLFKPWLNDIAKDGRDSPEKSFIAKLFQRLRFGVTLGTMGFKASTGIIQVSGLSNSVAELGNANVLRGLRDTFASGGSRNFKMLGVNQDAWEWANANSKVLNHRTQTMDREIKNAMQQISGKRGVIPAVQEASMKHIAYIQTYMVDLPTWYAAYHKGMKDFNGDEGRAFRYADFSVENIHGSGANKDMARLMRLNDELARQMSMFMTFFSALWNQERDLFRGAVSGQYSPTQIAGKLLFLFAIPVAFEMMMRGELTDEDENEEERLQKYLTNLALYPVQSVPLLRDVANVAATDFPYRGSPAIDLMSKGLTGADKVVRGLLTDEEITKAQLKNASKLGAAAAGIPGVNQAWATGEHLFDVLEEGEDLTLHQLLFGPERD